MQTEPRVTFRCQGACGEHYPREELKVAEGRAYCAADYPAVLPAAGVKAPHVRGPSPEWRRR